MTAVELYKGRPQNIEGRLDREVRVYDLLDSLGIEYLRTDHGHADTMEACNEIDKVLDVLICKNLFLCNRQKTKFYLLMMPGDKPFKTKELSSQINSARLSFASAEAMEEYLDILPLVSSRFVWFFGMLTIKSKAWSAIIVITLFSASGRSSGQ